MSDELSQEDDVIYIGIYIGDIQGARKHAADTNQALQALEDELRSDLVRLDEVIDVQTITVGKQVEAMALLGAEELDEEAINAAFERVIVDNSTFFPNQSAYSTMQSQGYLSALPDEALRLQITRLVEREYTRADLNAEKYDDLGFVFALEILPGLWDRTDKKLLPGNPNRRATLKTAVMGINNQGEFYLEFIRDTVRAEMIKTLDMIDAYQSDGEQK